MTGKYPARLHLTTYIPGPEIPHTRLIPPPAKKLLDPGELTFGEAFKAADYETLHIGKWHLGPTGPEGHGFEKTFYSHGISLQGDPKGVNQLTRATEGLLELHKDKPFVMVLSHYSVHAPLEAKEEKIKKYVHKPAGRNGQNNPVMAAMIEEIDDSVGRIMQKLKQLEIEDHTAVILFSDNGGLVSPSGEEAVTSNRPLRGGKSMLYEGGIRVPLIVKWPGAPSQGSTCNVPVISTDFFPTLLEMTGLPPRPEQHVDGMSLAPLLRGEEQLGRKHLYWHYPHYQAMAPHGAVRSGKYKLIEFYEDGLVELYDLKKDVGEKNNLAVERPEKAESLRRVLHEHLKSVHAQMPTIRPD
jgi:arylsulfatase A-like enzyme